MQHVFNNCNPKMGSTIVDIFFNQGKVEMHFEIVFIYASFEIHLKHCVCTYYLKQK